MKKAIIIYLILLIVILAGCVNEEKTLTDKDNLTRNNEQSDSNVFYFGEGKEWFGAYTIYKVRTSYFESLYIQYLTDRTGSVEEQTTKNIGKIEYILNISDSAKLESSFPQPLKGVGNFHTATEINAKLIDSDFSERITLTINWKDKKEVIELKKQ